MQSYTDRICQYCQKPFKKLTTEVKRGHGKFCSLTCRWKGVAENSKQPRIACLCQTCGNVFLVPKKRIKRGPRFCSRQCQCFKKKTPKPKLTTEERFWSRVNKTDHCWLWLGKPTYWGYGKIGVGKGKQLGAHVFSWILHNGPIPDGKIVCHNCLPIPDNKLCVHPLHLWLGTDKENLEDASQKGTMVRGEQHRLAKFTDNQIILIREMRARKSPFKEIARMFDVHVSTIQSIVYRKTWKHI